MHKQFYFLSPVEVVKVTSQNLDEVAEWCGGTVQETESRRVPGRMDKYVWVPTPKGNNISWAFPGMFITKRLVVTVKGELRATWAVFRRDYFEKNYFASNSDAGAATWERELLEAQAPKKVAEVTVNVSVADALKDAQAAVGNLQEKLDKANRAAAEGISTYLHDHSSEETCDQNDCDTDRYADGIQAFTDKSFEPGEHHVEGDKLVEITG